MPNDPVPNLGISPDSIEEDRSIVRSRSTRRRSPRKRTEGLSGLKSPKMKSEEREIINRSAGSNSCLAKERKRRRS